MPDCWNNLKINDNHGLLTLRLQHYNCQHSLQVPHVNLQKCQHKRAVQPASQKQRFKYHRKCKFEVLSGLCSDCPTVKWHLTFIGPCIVIIILTYIQQDATLHSLFYLKNALHVSGGTTTHHQERKQLYLQHVVFLVCSSPLCWRYNCQYTYVKNRRNTAVIMSANKLRLLYCCYKATTCFDPVNRAIFRSSTM